MKGDTNIEAMPGKKDIPVIIKRIFSKDGTQTEINIIRNAPTNAKIVIIFDSLISCGR